MDSSQESGQLFHAASDSSVGSVEEQSLSENSWEQPSSLVLSSTSSIGSFEELPSPVVQDRLSIARASFAGSGGSLTPSRSTLGRADFSSVSSRSSVGYLTTKPVAGGRS